MFREDPFCRASGDRLREEMLACGAAREPADIMMSLLGKSPSCDSYLRAIGLEGSGAPLVLPLQRRS
jgi:Zn-dependent oligopeptidase